MNLEERVTAIEEALGWHKQAQANTAPAQSGSKTGKTETTIHPETWTDMPQPGITAQDLDALLNSVSPDVFVQRISALKAKLAQPATGITVGQAAEWWATHTGYPNESSRIKAFLAFLHPEGSIGQVLSVEDIRLFFIRHQENWSELFNRGDGQRGAKLFYDFLASRMGTGLPLTHESPEVKAEMDKFQSHIGVVMSVGFTRALEDFADALLASRGPGHCEGTIPFPQTSANTTLKHWSDCAANSEPPEACDCGGFYHQDEAQLILEYLVNNKSNLGFANNPEEDAWVITYESWQKLKHMAEAKP